MSEPDSRLVAAEVCRQVGDNHTAEHLRREHEDLDRQRREYLIEIARAGWACAGDVSEGTLNEWGQLPECYQSEQVAFADGVVRKLVEDGHVQGTWQAMPGAAEWWADVNGRVVVDLPEPDSVDDVNGFTAWCLPQVNAVTAFADGEVAIDGHIGGLTIAEARDVAARLLAAARVAEGGT